MDPESVRFFQDKTLRWDERSMFLRSVLGTEKDGDFWSFILSDKCQERKLFKLEEEDSFDWDSKGHL